MVDKLLQGLEGLNSAYMDDVIVFSTSWGDHLHHLSSVLGRIQEAGLTIRKRKCQFAMAECGYLVMWTPECDQAFQSLKTALSSTPLLCSPDFTKRFILQTDALERGVGAVLSQYDKNEQD